ncbi:hypothetical protein ACJRO7_006773 [Eucalyptus globulus]|uniref:PGG domain-containing protein n=1 Tax=Eucalyptus globulus TaxID=34317 RepID=A0ABD3IIV7_EUCGL
MEHAVSIDRSAKWATQIRRLEDLKARCVPTPNNQQELRDGDLNKIMDRDLYEATKEGDIEKFINALEKVYESRKLALSHIFNQVTPSGNSLLHVAASSRRDYVMELILIHFPHTMTRKISLEDTPLHIAVQDKRFDATKMLIRWGTDSKIIYWKNKGGKSPLCLAIEKFKFEGQPREEAPWEILRLLLQESARDEAYAVKMAMSPILATIKYENTDLLKEIIDRFPKLLHLRDEDGGTPMHAAASVGDDDAIGLLLEKCPHLALQTDKNAGNFGPIERLLKDTWPDLAEIKNKKHQNILHVAAKGRNDYAPDTIEKLVNAKDVDRNTPLHLASMHNHCEVMRSLTKVKRIRLELRNNDGLTALDVGMESRSLSTEHPAVVKSRDALLLREQGSGASKSSPAEWIKDQVNTLLLVATLAASSDNAYDELHPRTATMLHHRMFRVFIIANMLAMYSSILAVVVLLWGLNRDFYVAELAYHSAGPLMLMALTGMSMAFFAAISVAVSRLAWLGSLAMSVGVLYLTMVVVVLAALIFPSSKTTMFIVVFYYIVVYTVIRSVKFRVKVFYGIIFRKPALLFTFCFQIESEFANMYSDYESPHKNFVGLCTDHQFNGNLLFHLITC